jgi:hypothetical protein
MRGQRERSGSLFSRVAIEERIPASQRAAPSAPWWCVRHGAGGSRQQRAVRSRPHRPRGGERHPPGLPGLGSHDLSGTVPYASGECCPM